jgi:phosphoenolpyruvate carboxylase
MRNAGIPVQGIPPEHIGAQPAQQQQSDVLTQANPNFQGMMASDASQFHSGGGVPLPDASKLFF